MPATPTLQPIAQFPDVSTVQRMRIEMGTTLPELAMEEIEDVRPGLREAMKLLDSSETRDLHVKVGKLVNDLDDLRAVLAERHSS